MVAYKSFWKQNKKEILIFSAIAFGMILITGSFLGYMIYDDYQFHHQIEQCQTDSFAIRTQITKLCSITSGGSFTYLINKGTSNEKECKVDYKC